jgi:hypothetical protein
MQRAIRFRKSVCSQGFQGISARFPSPTTEPKVAGSSPAGCTSNAGARQGLRAPTPPGPTSQNRSSIGRRGCGTGDESAAGPRDGSDYRWDLRLIFDGDHRSKPPCNGDHPLGSMAGREAIERCGHLISERRDSVRPKPAPMPTSSGPLDDLLNAARDVTMRSAPRLLADLDAGTDRSIRMSEMK